MGADARLLAAGSWLMRFLRCWLFLVPLGVSLPLNCTGRHPLASASLRSQFRSTFERISTSTRRTSNVKSEGCQPVMGLAGVTLARIQYELAGIVTNAHDHASSPYKILKGDSNKKRSLRRAQKRALDWGYAWYHGRIVTPASLGCHRCHTAPVPASAIKQCPSSNSDTAQESLRSFDLEHEWPYLGCPCRSPSVG